MGHNLQELLKQVASAPADKLDSILNSTFQAVQSADLSLEQRREVMADVGEAVVTNHAVVRLMKQVRQLRNLISWYNSFLDAALHDTGVTIVNRIHDFVTATEAIRLYNKDWFRSVMASTNAKQDLARQLHARVTQHTHGNSNDFWVKVIQNDPDALNELMAPDLNEGQGSVGTDDDEHFEDDEAV